MPHPHDYQIAIPSYCRAETLNTNTLRVFADRGIPKNKITVFTATTEEAHTYLRVLDAGLYGDIAIAEPGLKNARNHINTVYDSGQLLVQADDDLRDVLELNPDEPKKLRPIQDLNQLFTDNFTELHKENLTLWGVGAVPNHFFMRPGYSTSLKLCVGALWGCINQHAPHCQLRMSEKEDYERTLKHWDHAGGVLRRNDVAVKTRYYTEPGGMQTTRTIQHSADAAASLMARWPTLVRINPRRKGPHTEVLLSTRKRKT